MRERKQIEHSASRIVDGSTKDAVEDCSKLELEVLLDIRDLLESIDSRIDDLQSR